MSSEIGKSITQATRFLMNVRNDVLSLIASLDLLMADRGWDGVMRSALSTEHPLRHVYRMYARPSADRRIRSRLTILIDLDPPDPLDEAACLVVAAAFSADVDYKVVWNRWAHDDSRALLSAVGWTPEPQTAEQRLLEGSLNIGASRVLMLICPLARLSDSNKLRERIVEPASKMAQEVVAQV